MRHFTALVAHIVVLASGMLFAAEDGKPSKELVEVFEFYVGTWSVEGTMGETPFKGRASFRMPPGKHCVMGTVSMRMKEEGQQHFSLVSGWDSSTGWSTEQGVESTGQIYTVHWRKVSATKDEGEGVGTLDGEKTTSKVKLERKGEDEVVVDVIERTKGSESLPDIKIIYHRMAREKPKRKAKDK